MVCVGDETPNWSAASNEAVGTTTEAEIHDGMVWIPPGNVRLGQTGVTEPVHDFHVEGFFIDVYEVTNAQYREFIDAGGYETEAHWDSVGWLWKMANNITLPLHWDEVAHHGGGIPGNETFPVTGVSWYEADAYCRWAGKRLPTEAEWEKAAKGGCEMHGDFGQCDDDDTPSYPCGEAICGREANYWNSGDPYDRRGYSTPVGYYNGSNRGGYQTMEYVSPYGLYDACGNAWEWCGARYVANSGAPIEGSEDPPLTSDENLRGLRGGSWFHYFSKVALRSAYRATRPPHKRFSYYGFRCAMTD
jgi:formylglycine-generating enzyme required for sulfatase activity